MHAANIDIFDPVLRGGNLQSFALLAVLEGTPLSPQVHQKADLDKLTSDALQLGLCEVLGVASHASLGPAKGNVHHGGLPCCQTCQTAHTHIGEFR